MTREQHVEWCKQRATEYVNNGDLQNAYASMASDLGKHPETKDHPAIQIGLMLMMQGQLSSPAEMQKFIDGFH